MTRSIVIAALAASCLVVPAAAQMPETSVVVVRHGDLDLRTPGGVARLDQRIRRAAARACDNTSVLDLVASNRKSECAAASTAAARDQRDRVVARLGHANDVAAR